VNYFSFFKRCFTVVLALVLMSSHLAHAQSFGTSDAAKANLRMDAIEDQMRRMNGDVERLSFEIRQLTERFSKFSEDIEFRLKEIQQGRPASSNSPSPQTRDRGPVNPGNRDSGPVRLGPRSDNSIGIPPSSSSSAGPRVLGQIPSDGSTGSAQIASLDGQANASVPQKGLYERSYEKLHAKDYAGAERGFKTFIQQNPKSDLISNAHYWLGETYYARQQYKDAARFFLNGYKKYPKGRKAPDNLFKLGMTLKKLGQKDQSCAALNETKRRFPKANKDLKKRLQGEIRKSGC